MENILEALEELPKIFDMFFNSRITRALIIIFAFIISINILTKKLIPYCIKHTSIPYYQTYTYYLIHKSKLIRKIKPFCFACIELSPFLLYLSSFIALLIIFPSLFKHVHILSFLNKNYVLSILIDSFILILINATISTLYIHWIIYLFEDTALSHRIKMIYQYPWWVSMELSELILAISVVPMILKYFKFSFIILLFDVFLFAYGKYIQKKMNYKIYQTKINNIYNKKVLVITIFAIVVIFNIRCILIKLNSLFKFIINYIISK